MKHVGWAAFAATAMMLVVAACGGGGTVEDKPDLSPEAERAARVAEQEALYEAALAAAEAHNQMCKRHRLAAHMLVVADALQLLLRDRLTEARRKMFYGGGTCSDESPPRANRFAGYRFQITWIYVPFIPSVDAWALPANDERAPIHF